MLVCCRELFVYQGSPVVLMMDCDRDDTGSQRFCWWRTRWWSVLKWNCVQQRSHSSLEYRQTDEQYSSVSFLMINWMIIFVKTFILVMKQYVIVSTVLMEHFSSSICHFPHLLPVNEHSSSLHSFRRRFLHQDYSWNSELWLTSFGISSEKLYNIMNYISQLGLYCYCDSPLWCVTTHLSLKTLPHFIYLQRTEIFFPSQIPTSRVYSAIPIPYRNY